MVKRIGKFTAIAVALCMFFTSVPITTISAQQTTGSSESDGNVIVNGSFEATSGSGEATGWTKVIAIAETDQDGITYQQDGTVLFDGHFSDSDLLLQQTVNVTAGDINKLSGKVRMISGAPTLVLDVTYYNAQNVQVGEKVSVDFSAVNAVSETLSEVISAEYTAPEEAVSAVVSVGMKGIGSCVWDDVNFGKAFAGKSFVNGSFEDWSSDTVPSSWTVQASEGDTVQKQADDLMMELSGKSSQEIKITDIEPSTPEKLVTYTVEAKYKQMVLEENVNVLRLDFCGGCAEVGVTEDYKTKAGDVIKSTKVRDTHIINDYPENYSGITTTESGTKFRQTTEIILPQEKIGKWIEVTGTYEAPAILTALKFYVRNNSGTTPKQNIYLDDVVIYKSTDPTKNLLTNGDFISGTNAWGESSFSVIADIDIQDGTYAPIFSGTQDNSDVSVTSEKFSVVAGNEISFAAKMLPYEGNSQPYIKVNYYDASGSLLDTVHGNTAVTGTAGQWNEISSDTIGTELTVPTGAVWATVTVGQTGMGQCLWDAVQITTDSGYVFENQLNNGSFQTDLSGWESVIGEIQSDEISILTDNVSFWLSNTKTSSGKLCVSQDIDVSLVEGSVDENGDGDYTDEGETVTYTIKAKMKATATTVNPRMDFFGGTTNGYVESIDNVREAKTGYKFRQYQDVVVSEELVGQWIEVEKTYKAPADLKNLRLWIRERGIGTVYWDDITIYKNGDPNEIVLLNGSFNQLTDNFPDHWVKTDSTSYVMDTHYGIHKEYNVAEGLQAAYYTGTQSGSDVALTQEVSVIGGKTYLLSAQAMRYEGNSIPYLNIVFYDGNEVETGRIDKVSSSQTYNVWEEIMEKELIIPSDTVKAIITVGQRADGTCFWDDVCLIDKDQISEEMRVELISEEFREMLASEAANATLEVGLPANDINAYDPPYAGQSNLVLNGDFELHSGNSLDYWTLKEEYAQFMEVEEDGGDEGAGDACVKMYVPAGDEYYQQPFYDQWVNVIGGAEYQISYKYKVVTTNENGSLSHRPVIKAECWSADQDTPGAGTLLEKSFTASLPENGQWFTYTKKLTVPTSVTKVRLLLRTALKGNMDGSTTVYHDDLEMYMTQPPEPITLSTDQVFYYSDIAESGIGTITTKTNLNYFPELEGKKLELKIRDLTASAEQQQDVYVMEEVYACSAEIVTDFELKWLLGNNNSAADHTYEVIATIYGDDAGTVVKQTEVTRIFITNRPGCVYEDGTYHVYDASAANDGNESTPAFAIEPFNPEYAYHVKRSLSDKYMKLKESGINVVQVSNPTTTEGAISILDSLKEAGIMGFIALYNNMKPAGHESNIDNTILIVNAVKDHPALFGYAIMDEPYLHLTEPDEVMQTSYRLIHAIDPNHPVMIMENLPNWVEASSKYADIFCIDPYREASAQFVADFTQEAIAAVENKKPVYVLLEAYRTMLGRYPTPDDLRNNIWQALIKGGAAVGYYSITDSEKDAAGEYKIPIWDALDGGALWQAICDFNTYEKELAYNHFVFDKSEVYTESAGIGDDYWYSSWKADDGNYYMVVLSMLEEADATQEVTIPLNKEGDEAYGRFNATALSGRITDDGAGSAVGEIFAGTDSLEMTLKGWEAILLRIDSVDAVEVKLGAYDEEGTVVSAITVPGTDSYYVNDVVTINAPVTEGYNFCGWYEAETDNNGVIIGFVGDALSAALEYSFTVTEDVALAAVYKAVELKEETEGVSDSYRLSTDGTLIVEATTEALTEIKVDGTTVDPSKYTVNTDAGTVTFDKAYAESLSVGEHTVTLVYSGGYAESVLKIVEALDVVEVKSDLTFTSGSESDVVNIYCNGEYEKFVSVEVNGSLVDPSNYTVKAGSTVLTFKASYLENLSVGTHSVKLNYTDGSITTALTVAEKQAVSDSSEDENQNNAEQDAAGGSDISTENTTVNVGSSSNDTGDHSNVYLWIMLLVITAAAVGVVIRKKRN